MMRVVGIGWRYAGGIAALGLAAAVVMPPLGLAVFVGAAAVLLFFRDPARDPPAEGVLAPADGRVQVLRTEDDRVRLGIFMNLFDVHVNRAPVGGVVVDRDHRPGGYRPAFTKSADRNERVDIDVETDAGEYTVSLIAGTVARRITPYAEVGDDIAAGDRIGHIAFGSRVDVLFPPGIGTDDVVVARGDRVTAGETVLVPADRAAAGTDGTSI